MYIVASLDRSKKNLNRQIARLRVLTQKVGAQVEIKSTGSRRGAFIERGRSVSVPTLRFDHRIDCASQQNCPLVH